MATHSRNGRDSTAASIAGGMKLPSRARHYAYDINSHEIFKFKYRRNNRQRKYSRYMSLTRSARSDYRDPMLARVSIGVKRIAVAYSADTSRC